MYNFFVDIIQDKLKMFDVILLKTLFLAEHWV